MIYLNKDFQKYWDKTDPFEQSDRLEGEVFRHVKSRRTLRLELEGKSYFAKIHHGVGWLEIIKNILMLKKPVISARNEYNAIRKLEELAIPTMKVAAFGQHGKNPANIHSFIITEELTNTISLEDFCNDWKQNPPTFSLKKKLIEYLARTSRTLHTNGINHNDYYICHFLLDKNSISRQIQLKLSLIDLHRARIHSNVPFRWRVKDIGGLYFSAMDIGLTRSDRLRFVKLYSGKSLRQTLTQDKRFWNAVTRRAVKTYRKDFGKIPAAITGNKS